MRAQRVDHLPVRFALADKQCAALAGTRIVLLVAGCNIRVIDQGGQLLRNFELDPSRDYQARSLG